MVGTSGPARSDGMLEPLAPPPTSTLGDCRSCARRWAPRSHAVTLLPFLETLQRLERRHRVGRERAQLAGERVLGGRRLVEKRQWRRRGWAPRAPRRLLELLHRALALQLGEHH